MLSKKFLSVMTSAFLLAGVGATSAAKTVNPVVPEQTVSIGQDVGGPTDLSIANEEKVIEMLKKEGKIAKNATYEEAQKVYLKFMQEAAKANKKLPISKFERDLKAKQNQRVEKYKFEKRTTDTNPKKVNVLTLLVDYQDYKHNSIQPGESDMYYKDYSHKHFEDMIYGDNGYEGPNGEKLISMKQYYLEQSGGSLIVEGKVAGWYTLPQTAAYYGAEQGGSNDVKPRNAVAHALQLAAKDSNINFADFDKEDIYDSDGDGNYNEPDGIIDYLMVLHAGVGQEAGGGSLGSDAIWSHRWNLGGLYKIPGTNYYAYDYTIEPEDGAAGVFAHEFGHNLGLPDEYDTNYTSTTSEPIAMWSIMSSGSWSGKVPGTEPTGFSPYAKEIFQALYGGNWQKQINIDFNKLTSAGAKVTLRQADEEGQAVKVSLPDKAHVITTPTSGKNAYWGGKGHDGAPILTNMTTNVDLTGKTSATLKFKTWYDIEEGWDYASVQVREVGTTDWTYLQNNLTTSEGDPQRDVIVPHGITGASNGWVDASFDLSNFAGKKIEVKLEYETDAYSFGAGWYVDDIQVLAGDTTILSDDAEGTDKFALNGFEKNTGTVYAPHYYLVEWRNHHGVDTGLAHVGTLGQAFAYDPGMVVWYVDNYFTDNWGGVHPGEGYLSVVDADQKNQYWYFDDASKKPVIASSGRYHMHDAAFSKDKDSSVDIYYAPAARTVIDTNRYSEPSFDDRKDYTNPELPSLGVKLPKLGLKIQITNQAQDNSSASITIKK
ncbi:immune inhibitor A [Clostridium swellfunianum]|uniref:immune inhibitor A domain-containing protein n=1 Tax=Clostridium swellfunianum TaxID=1367462 RepID=UPI00202F3BA6|nr:immune inhibitor A domain-containing protein [Clostridium swellfunianum]MCM0649815.1 immune inhibitor A [Clostridium swellfunianum]